jgi:Ribbon-helix-helix protein, copG family
MKRTTVMFPDDVAARVRVEARRRGVPLAEVVREAVEQYLPPVPSGQPLSFFAISEGESGSASERVDEHVRRAIRRELER